MTYKRVYIDYETFVRIMQQAVANNGRVVFEAKGFMPLEVEIDPEYAWKELTTVNRRVIEAMREKRDE